jgi:hypothetical protein
MFTGTACAQYCRWDKDFIAQAKNWPAQRVSATESERHCPGQVPWHEITSAINQTMLFDGSGQSRFAPQHLHFGESYLTHHHSLGALGDKISAGDSLARCVVQYWSPPLATYRVRVSCPPVFSMGRQRNPRPSRPRHLNLLAIRSCEHEA